MILTLKLLPPLLGVLLLGTLGLAGQDSAAGADEKTLDQWKARIEKVRGLKFKEPVRVERIARGAGEDPGKQGYYDPAAKRLVLFADVKGNYQQGVLIHELVHALQDQHFNLQKLGAKLHNVDDTDDEALALAALIEGDASLTMVEVLKDEQPAAGKMLEGKLEGARNLRNAFLYGQGGRYVQALKAKGGWKSVDMAYFVPPSSTRAILDPGTRKPGINLGPGKVRGAFGLLEALLACPGTKDQAVSLAKAWRGDRLEEKSCCTVLTVLMDTADAAGKLANALALASGWWFDAASPLAALAALAAAAWTRRAQEQQQQRQELQGLLQQTTSTSVAGELWRQRELLLEGGRFPGRRLELTVLFTDIEHFTQVAEQLDPEALLAWLNRGMAAMVAPVQGEGGLVNKFTGDGLLAVFGAPLDRGTQLEGLAAVQAAATIRRALATLNAQLKAEGLPEMRVRIGIHTGPVLAGSVGTPERWEFSVVGDTVNCAARIEGLQHNEGPSPACRVLLSGTTLALVRETIRGPWKLWGTLPLSGRSTAVEVWELLEKESA